MRNQFIVFFILFVLVGAIVACERNDDEPVLPPTRISRLYVSFSDIQNDDLGEPFKNIAIFDPSDGPILSELEWFESNVIEVAGITFDPFVSRVFQYWKSVVSGKIVPVLLVIGCRRILKKKIL